MEINNANTNYRFICFTVSFIIFFNRLTKEQSFLLKIWIEWRHMILLVARYNILTRLSLGFYHHIKLVQKEVRNVMIGIALEVIIIGNSAFNINLSLLNDWQRLAKSVRNLLVHIVNLTIEGCIIFLYFLWDKIFSNLKIFLHHIFYFYIWLTFNYV